MESTDLDVSKIVVSNQKEQPYRADLDRVPGSGNITLRWRCAGRLCQLPPCYNPHGPG